MKQTGSLLARGRRRQRAGQFTKAERAYREVLAQDPENADALHLLGVAAAHRGDHGLAAASIAAAIRVGGPLPGYCASLASVLRAQGRHKEAAACYRQAAAGDPADTEYPLELARTLLIDSRPAEAADVLVKHLSRHAGSAPGWHLLGLTFFHGGSYRESAEALQQSLSLQPGAAEPWYDLGIVLARMEAWEASEDAYRHAVQARPDFPDAWNNLGNLARRHGRNAEAVGLYRRALSHRGNFPEALYNLGVTLQSLDRLEEARAAYSSALALQPKLAVAHNNLANTLLDLGEPASALASYRWAIDLDGAKAEYRVNLGMAQLLTGQFGEGWRNYAARLSAPVSGVPLWNGAPLHGKRILLRVEQGYGDTIQFVRYSGLLKELGADVVLACPPPLARLLSTMRGIDHLMSETQDLPPCDFWAPLLHLPGVLGTRPETIPGAVPYLFADAETSRSWGEILDIPPSHLKVGIAWRGSPTHRNDRNRSIDPTDLAALAGVPDTSFVSLQQGCPAGCHESTLPFVPLPRDLGDFADTAALMTALDLVVTVDTSIAHLAGALARPVWTLLPFAPDWRWMRERQDSPWYPSMKLFRQQRRGDWRGVLEHVRQELRHAPGRRDLDGR